MGKKKARPFIDRKHASTYTLMHRTQAELALLSEEPDGLDVSSSNMVLWPLDGGGVPLQPTPSLPNAGARDSRPQSSSALSEWKRQLQQARLVLDEESDANRYLKELSGDGVFVSAQGGHATASRAAAAVASSSREEELPTLLFDNVDLTTDCLDDDMAALLLGDGDFEGMDGGDDSLLGLEELDDDFCFQAAQEPETDADENFDYDAHVRQLLERARRERDGGDEDDLANHRSHPGASDRDYFRSLRPLRECDDDDDDDGAVSDGSGEFDEGDLASWMQAPGVIPKLAPEEERALCEKFEATLAEYDTSDEEAEEDHGDCDDVVREGYGPRRELEGDKELEAALDDFLTEKRDEILVQGTKAPRDPGSGYSALVGTRMIPASQLQSEQGLLGSSDEAEPVEAVLAEANDILAQPIEVVPPEEILLIEEDGKSYLSERSRNPWDCESILSTYSNLDNNPVVIEHRRRPPTKAKKIVLSQKTGLPIQPRVEPIPEEEEEPTATTVNRGAARNKRETADEKRARKAAAKVERQVARLQKKVTRSVFEQEFQKRAVVTDTTAGNAVFRYS